MSLNGAGVFIVNSAGQPVVASTLITSAAFNAFTADVATALSTAIYRDGQAVYTSNQPMGGFKHTGAGAAVASGEYLMYGQANASLTSLSINGSAILLTGALTTAGALTTTGAFATTFAIPGAFTYTFPPATSTIASAQTLQSQLYQAFTTGGSSTAYTLTPTPATAANTTNQRFRVAFHTTAGATPTLAVSGQTAKDLKYKDSTGAKAAVSTTQIPASWIADVEYDGTDWVVLDVPPVSGGFTILDAAGDMIYASAADTPARLPIGTAGQTLKVNAGATAPEWVTGSGYVCIEEQETAGVNGGTLTSGSWQKRVLTTEISDASGLASLSSGVITLAAGTYRFQSIAQAYNCNQHQARLRDTTNSVTLGTGISATSSAAISTVMTSQAAGRFTIAGATNIELQHRCATTSSAGLGLAAGFDLEVYARVEFWKE